MIALNLEQIADKATRNVLQSLLDSLNASPLLKGNWQFLELTITGNATTTKKHRLNFRPKDAIIISKTGPATLTVNFDSFTLDTVSFTTAGVGLTDITTIRAFIGSHQET